MFQAYIYNVFALALNKPDVLPVSTETAKRIMDERSKAIRSRERYENYEAEVLLKRKKISNLGDRGRQALEEIMSDLDLLYDQYASRTSNAVIIDADQRAFRNTVEMISERMKNQASTVMGEFTIDSMTQALRDQVLQQGSGTDVLELIGALFSRGSRIAPVPWALPTLAETNRETRGSRGPVARPPSGAPEEAGMADESEFVTDRIQRMTQALIVSVVQADEKANDYEPLLLHRLCFDKNSFVRTLENFFAASVLVKEQKLWIGSNKRGLPVVGSATNRDLYIRSHPNDAIGPDPSIDLANFSQDRDGTIPRQQFSVNLTYELYNRMQDVFGDEEPMLIRTDYDNDGGSAHSSANGGLQPRTSANSSAHSSKSAGSEQAELGSQRPRSSQGKSTDLLDEDLIDE